MEAKPYNLFYRNIHQAAKSKGSLLRVMLELTYRCNFHCAHCYVPESYRKYGELDTRGVCDILDKLSELGCFYLGFTGGEPFLRDDMMDLIRHARKKGFETIIYTNGSRIDRKTAQGLSKLRLNKVDITIPALTESRFDRITQTKGEWSRVLNAIKLLKEYHVPLGFKTCVLKENENEIRKIREFAASYHALLRLDDRLSPRLDGSMEPYRYRADISDRRSVLAKSVVAPNAESRFYSSGRGGCRQGSKTDDRSLFYCGVGVNQAAITPLGELKMCLMVDSPKYKINVSSKFMRNTNKHSQTGKVTMDLQAGWDKLKKSVEAIKPDENYRCDSCNLASHCKWCPARAWLTHGNFTSCVPDYDFK